MWLAFHSIRYLFHVFQIWSIVSSHFDIIFFSSWCNSSVPPVIPSISCCKIISTVETRWTVALLNLGCCLYLVWSNSQPTLCSIDQMSSRFSRDTNLTIKVIDHDKATSFSGNSFPHCTHRIHVHVALTCNPASSRPPRKTPGLPIQFETYHKIVS